MKSTRTLAETIAFFVIAIAAFALGYYGYSLYRPELAFTDYFMSTIKLFAFTIDYKWTPATAPDIPVQLTIARWLAACATSIAVIKTYGLIVKEHKDRIRLLCFWNRNHIVVCGLGERGACLTMHLLGENKTVAIIESDSNNANLAAARAAGALIIIGDATSEPILRMAQIQKAAQVHIMLGDDNKVMSAAIACRNIAARTRRDPGSPLECDAHMQRPHAKKLFKAHSLFTAATDTFYPRIIDDNLLAAQRLLLEHAARILAPLQTSPTPPHIVIAGAGCIGQNLLLQMAHILHPGSGKPLDITLVDTRAPEREKEFATRYPFISEPPNIKPVVPFIAPRFVTGDITLCDDDLMKKIRGPENKPIHGVFLCIADETDELAAALLLRSSLGDSKAPIVVCTNTSAGLSDLFKDKAVQNYNEQNIHIHNLTRFACEHFGANGAAIEELAQALHLDYFKRLKTRNETAKENFVPWEKLTEHFKESNRNQAFNLLLNLAIHGYTFHLRNPDGSTPKPETAAAAKDPLYPETEMPLLGEMEHRRWMIEKYLDGWTLGDEDPARKLKRRPDLKPWADLDLIAKEKDTAPIEATLRLLTTSKYVVWKNQ